MKARAPGKLVLSGAYAVLEGAPALVLAADRYVIADTSRAATYQAEEVLAAVTLGMIERPIWYDVSALREAGPGGGRKLGLGSSAAIVVATLAACRLAAGESPRALGRRLLPDALRAHRQAQPRGSGIDVAASCLGGVVHCQLDMSQPQRPLTAQAHRLPPGLCIEVYASADACSTAGMLNAVQALRERDPQTVQTLLQQARQGAEQALAARSVDVLVAALRRQYVALGALGRAAGIDIVGPAAAALDGHAR
ncbi:MAG TPA: hypothetical protein ENK23_08190, partial [Sorangium sp.]|nr:hypothetical protein [Sorangium sp.]